MMAVIQLRPPLWLKSRTGKLRSHSGEMNTHTHITQNIFCKNQPVIQHAQDKHPMHPVVLAIATLGNKKKYGFRSFIPLSVYNEVHFLVIE